LNLFGVVCAFITLSGSFITDFLYTIGMVEESNKELCRVIAILIYVFLIAVPMALPRKMDSLRYLATLSLVAIFYVTLVVVVQTPAYIIE